MRLQPVTKDYAFITGWSRIQQGIPSRDPFLKEALSFEEQQLSGFVLGAPVGGNIGVIEDPFGTPKLIAATAGEFVSMPDGIMLSADGKTLYASFSAQNIVRVFDVQKMFAQITKPENREPLYSRRDSPPNFTRLEISPLDGPGGLGVNLPLDNTIEQPGIATGRFPQGMALAESNKVTIGFGREKDDADSLVINPEAEAGDTTPIIRWKVNWNSTQLRDAATSRLYLSVFPEGKGLFDKDQLDENGNDLFAHRILTRVQADHTIMGNDDVFQVDLGTIEPLRQLTLGQIYYIGIEVLNSAGQVIQTASREFKLEQALASTPFSSVTLVTHGFQPSVNSAGYLGDFIGISDIPKAFFELGNHISEAGSGGLVAKYRKQDGQWIIESTRGVLDVNSAAGFQGKPLVLLSDWITESSISDSGFSEAAADATFASLIQLDRDLNGAIFSFLLHFIGLS